MGKRTLVVVIVCLVLLFALAIASAAMTTATGTAEAGREMACTNEPQVGIETMLFNGADYALQPIQFMPVCSGQPAVLVTGWGDYGPDETATGKALGLTVGGVSLQLNDVYTGTANVSWLVIPAQ